jgi:hypothetical protein
MANLQPAAQQPCLSQLGRRNDPYLTMSPEYQAVIAGAFVDFLD